MKFQILFLLLAFTTEAQITKSDSLNFQSYHMATNNAEILLYEKKFPESMQQYLNAFTILNPSLTDLVNSTITAAMCKNKVVVRELLLKSFSSGLNIDIVLKKKIIREVLDKNEIIQIYNNADKSQYDPKLKNIIDSLIAVDQNNRLKKTVNSKDIDTQNALFLKKLIISEGFPSESKIGYYPSIYILFSHNLAFWLSNENIDFTNSLLFKGNISPEVYALLQDRMKLHKTNFKERVYYLPYNFLGENSRRKKFSVIPIDNYINFELIPKINEKRERIGLQNVEKSQKINEKKFNKKYQLLISGLL